MFCSFPRLSNAALIVIAPSRLLPCNPIALHKAGTHCKIFPRKISPTKTHVFPDRRSINKRSTNFVPWLVYERGFCLFFFSKKVVKTWERQCKKVPCTPWTNPTKMWCKPQSMKVRDRNDADENFWFLYVPVMVETGMEEAQKWRVWIKQLPLAYECLAKRQ